MSNIVLDSAAVLALILAEPGGEKIEALLNRVSRGEAVNVAISAVNWCEVLTRLHRENDDLKTSEFKALLAGVELIPFDVVGAELAASYSRLDRSISLGDRACLALAVERKATAWTTDRVWARFKLSIPVKLLR